MDRNIMPDSSAPGAGVALRKESVDRNLDYCDDEHTEWSSLSARRAWIEIFNSKLDTILDKRRSPQGERG